MTGCLLIATPSLHCVSLPRPTSSSLSLGGPTTSLSGVLHVGHGPRWTLWSRLHRTGAYDLHETGVRRVLVVEDRAWRFPM